MNNENIEPDKLSCDNEKIELPKDIQKRMMQFFLYTSIPRKKAISTNPPPVKEKAGE